MTKTVPIGRGRLPDSWQVDLPVFAGPLDLLLELIRVNEVEIADIPVVTICDQFHEYLGLMEELDLDIAGEYIYEAALLIQLKARTLLPSPPVGEDAAEDPRYELVQRLLDYQRLKEAAEGLAATDSVRAGMWTRTPQESAFLPPDAEEATLDLEEVSLYDLLQSLQNALTRYDREHPEPLIYHGDIFPIRVQFERYLTLAVQGKPYDLVDDLLSLSCRGEVVAAFLAVLELSRLQLIRLHQTETGDIVLYRTTRSLADDDLRAIQG